MDERDRITNEYFEWMVDLVCGDLFDKGISYRKVLSYLHTVQFRYTVHMDENREGDGVALRDRFMRTAGYKGDASDYIYIFDDPNKCSVLEMMIALAVRCEETIMDDPRYGDRTSQWFWGMMNNLGLGAMYDGNYDRDYVHDVVERLLNRKYNRDGSGGLFTVRKFHHDMRKAEIWYQMNEYLNGFV